MRENELTMVTRDPVSPSWVGHDDIPKATSIRDMTFGERNA